jgi:hypothetical protein
MSVGDIEKLKLGEELVCIEDYHPILHVGEIYYFIMYYKENKALYLTTQPINSNSNPSSVYHPDVAKYLERRSELRRQKINNILQ